MTHRVVFKSWKNGFSGKRLWDVLRHCAGMSPRQAHFNVDRFVCEHHEFAVDLNDMGVSALEELEGLIYEVAS